VVYLLSDLEKRVWCSKTTTLADEAKGGRWSDRDKDEDSRLNGRSLLFANACPFLFLYDRVAQIFEICFSARNSIPTLWPELGARDPPLNAPEGPFCLCLSTCSKHWGVKFSSYASGRRRCPYDCPCAYLDPLLKMAPRYRSLRVPLSAAD